MATLADYKKAYFNYEILEAFEAGIELLGTEVKSIRAGRALLDGARIIVRGGEGYLVGATIPAFQTANATPGYDAARNRRVLLSKKELAECALAEDKKGLTIVPLSLYEKGHLIKLKLAIVRGKKTHDKRETIKKREAERDIARAYK